MLKNRGDVFSCYALYVVVKKKISMSVRKYTRAFIFASLFQVCTPFCTKNDNVCVKMTYYQRDVEKTKVKTVSFCGKGTLTSDDNEAVKSGCYTQENNQDGLDVEACFCDNDACNGALPSGLKVNYVFQLILLLILRFLYFP